MFKFSSKKAYNQKSTHSSRSSGNTYNPGSKNNKSNAEHALKKSVDKEGDYIDFEEIK